MTPEQQPRTVAGRALLNRDGSHLRSDRRDVLRDAILAIEAEAADEGRGTAPLTFGQQIVLRSGLPADIDARVDEIASPRYAKQGEGEQP